MAEMSSHIDESVHTWTRGDVKAALVRQARVAIVCFLALSAGAIAAVIMAPPVYEGQLKILVKRDRQDSVVSGAADHAATQSDLSETELLSQVELIKANDLLEKVAAEAGLAQRLTAADRARNDAEALALATASLRRDLTVAPIKKTWLMDVTYRSKDPHLARHVLDTLVRLYFEKHLALHRPTGTYQFFSEQSERARQDLEAAQNRLTQFSQRTHVVSPALEREGVLQKLVEFDGTRAQTAATLAETAQRQRALMAELSRVPAQHTAQVRTTDAAGVIQDVKARILTLEMKRAELLQKFTPAYRGVIEIDGQLREARTALAEAREAPVREETIADNPTRQWLDTELARTQAENAAIQARMGALSAAVSQYRARAQMLDLRDAEQKDLVRSVKETETKYLLYAQKQEEARISDELDRTRIANVVVAQAPTVAFEPQRTPSLAMLPLLLGVALMLSFALALVVDAIDPTVRPWSYSPFWLSLRVRRTVACTSRLATGLRELSKLTNALDARMAAREQGTGEGADRETGVVLGRTTYAGRMTAMPVADANGLG
jgi:uncharacterized protein involved in exopolysaccharide biosynthesis